MVVHVPLERGHDQLVVGHADVLLDLGPGRPRRQVVLVALVVGRAVLALAVGERRELADVLVAAEHRHEVGLHLELARRRLEAAHRLTLVQDADALTALGDDAGLRVGRAAVHLFRGQRLEVGREVGLLLGVLVGAFGLQERHRRVVLGRVEGHLRGVLLHVGPDVGLLRVPLRHVRADAMRQLGEDLAHVLGLAEALDHRSAHRQVRLQVVGAARVDVPALHVGRPRQHHVRERRGLVEERVDADVEPDLVLVEQDVLGRLRLRPGERGVDVVGHVQLDPRAVLLQVVVDDLADLHLVPDVRQHELRRVGEQRADLGLGRHLRLGEPLLVVAAGPHPAEPARLADRADQHVEQDDAAVVGVTVDVRAGAAVAHRGRRGRGRGELARDAADRLGGDRRGLLGPLGRVALDLLPELFERYVGPVPEELGVVELLADDGVRHAERDGAVGARRGHVELVAVPSGVRHPHVEGHQFGAVLEATALDALRAGDVALVRLEHVRAEVQDVLRALVVAEVPVGLEQVRQRRGAA